VYLKVSPEGEGFTPSHRETVIEFYNEGGGEVENKDPLLKPLNLKDEEKDDLIAFLDSLTGDPIEIEAPELPKKSDGSF
jgi:cytochrome c peroxidase